jgi:hypothetical protein
MIFLASPNKKKRKQENMKQTSTSFSTELLFFVIFTRFWQGEALMDGNMVTDFHTI